ncbi:oxygen-binding di-iron domain-containing protein [Archangium lipolyticum]|uniref:MBL fold metallo-hydrolase n=1 Tax=Archangium lipolyticum TaxID=2970465 RepID=UPI00214B0A9F|nr:MBL fold metallo-hydrolase [Archangium lipolyticum]
MSNSQAFPNRNTPPSNVHPPSDSQANDLRLVPVEIAPDTFWVGKREPGNIFYANPYLRRFRGTDAKTGRPNEFNLLIDPGSSSDFAQVSTKVTSLIGGLDRLSAVFINHQDPDVGSSASIISARYAPKAGILCSEDTWRLIVHQNLPRGRFIATEKFSHGLNVPTGHRLLPVPSPFCHFRGAVMLYDPETRVLFTGDLFGGVTDVNAQGLWADESDWNGIRAFHQIYMPVNLALQRVVATIRQLEPAVEIIAPQHGRLIRGPLIQMFLDRMEKLPVGLDIMDEAQDRSHLQAWNAVLERVLTLARGYLGGSVDEKLMGSTELTETARLQNGQVSIQRLGRWTVEHVVELLCHGEPPEISGPIMMEATTAAAEYNLPTPHLDIEGNGVASNVSLLVG